MEGDNVKSYRDILIAYDLFIFIFTLMKSLHTLTYILLIIGGLNWLLVGLFGWDISQVFGGQAAGISRIIFILVGISAIVEMVSHKARCTDCTAPAPVQKM